jgi:hypothetical protein
LVLSRRKAIAFRWTSLGAAALFSSSAVLLLGFASGHYLESFLQWPEWVLAVASVGAGVAEVKIMLAIADVDIRLALARYAARWGLRHPLTYPPLWVSGFAGTGMTLLVVGGSSQVRASLRLADDLAAVLLEIGAIFAGCAAAVLGVAAVAATRRGKAKSPPPAAAERLALSSFESLREWLRKDQPVVTAADDAFGLAAIADRVARRLASCPPPAQAIVGHYGSGKSSLLELVTQILQHLPEGRRVRLVRVALWPYDTSRAAVEGVIQALVDALGEENDVVALRSVPAAYADAMSAVNGWLGALARIHGVQTPTSTLKAIDRVAIATGLQYVVWIEDLERFAGGHEPDEEKLNPIRALLYDLDQLEAVSVVTATTSLSLRFDLEKIARFVEEIPRLPELPVARILGTFRTGCREVRDYVDPADPNVRKKLDDLGDAASFSAREIFGLVSLTVIDALPILCSTPRKLKHALRACLDVWEELLGEIDFDDLLVLSILKEGQPDAFALLQQFLRHWRGGGRAEERAESQKAWDAELLKLIPDARSRAAVQAAVKFLFEPEDDDASKPQGVRQHVHADYWQRATTKQAPPPNERDQPVLATLVAGDTARIVTMLTNEQTSSAVEDFSHLLRDDQLIALLPAVVATVSAISAAKWPSEDPPGLIPLWRTWLRRARRGNFPKGEALNAVLRAYDAAVPASLATASAIEYYFVHSESNAPDLIGGSEAQATARRYVRSVLVDTYRESPAQLARSLAGARENVLLWLTWGLDRLKSEQLSGLPFERWQELAPSILAAVPLDPRTMLSQLACFVVRRDKAFRSRVTYSFDAELAARLFGDAARVLELFSAEEPVNWAEARHVLAVLAALGKVPPTNGDHDDD